MASDRRDGWHEPAFLASAVDAVETGVVIYDRDGVIRFVNRHYAELLHSAPDEIEGRHVTSLNPDFERERFDGYWDSFAAGETRRVETHHRTLQRGRLVPVSVAVTHTEIHDRECHVARVEKIVDEDHSQQLQDYRRLVENVPVGVIRTTPGPKGEFRLVNDAMVEIFDADSTADFHEISVADLYADRADRAAFSRRLQEEGTVRNVELELETFDDEPITCEVSAVAVRRDDEIVFEIALQDITERKRYERHLTLFREAVEHAGHSVLITDTDGRIEYVNPAFVDETGFGRREVVGETPRILKSGKQSEPFYEELWETILAGEVWEAELVNRRKSGELYYTKQTIAPITDDDGAIENFVAIQSDITEQKLREKRLSELTRILRHNLRNAVTALEGHARVLQDTIEGYHPRLDRIVDQAESLASTAEKMDDVRRILDDDHNPAASCDLAAVLAHLEPELRERYPEAAITVESEAAMATIEPETCRAVLGELVDNAVSHNDRATPEVTITVTDTRDDDGHVRLSVADNGPGIPNQERVAVEVGTEDPLVHGSGIGLSHVHLFVTEYGGDVTISDNQPRGSVVTLSLPRADNP